MPDLVPVRFRDCTCPGTPHPDGDVAYLRPYLDLAGGAAALAAIAKSDGTEGGIAPLVGPVYLRHGVHSWNVVDEDGPVPVEAVNELRWEDAYDLAEKADDLYGEQVLAPLVRRMSQPSKAGPTNGSTPRPRKSSKKLRKPWPPSSSPSSESAPSAS
jgi:hypothetical protein